MDTRLVLSGISRRTSCASCASADELAAEGKAGEEIAAELQVSPATLYNWRTYGGMDTDAASSKSCASKTPASSGCCPKPSWRQRPCWGEEKLGPAAKRRAVDMLRETLSMSERLACKAVGGPATPTAAWHLAQTPADP